MLVEGCSLEGGTVVVDQQLLSFVTAVEQQNFTRAAEILHTTQPAVSQHILNLERSLNVRLLERTSKYVRLNRAGEIVYQHAKEILSLYERMNRLIDDLVNVAAGPLLIGASLTFGEYVLPRVIAKFRELYPDIIPTIAIDNTHHVVEQVARGQLDVGIIEGTYIGNEVDIEPFAEDTVVVVASVQHPIAKQKRPRADQLAAETWIVREKGSGTREITDRVFSAYNIHPANVMEFGSTQVIKESVEAGLGITILSKWVIRKELLLGTLCEIPLAPPPIRRQFSIVTRKSDFHTKACELFCEFLRAQSHALKT